MKKLVAVLSLAIAASAHAGEISYVNNAVGGLIVLTDDQGSCAQGLLSYYTTNDTGGGRLYGCWMIKQPWIYTTDFQGVYHQYPAQRFTMTEYGNAKYPPR